MTIILGAFVGCVLVVMAFYAIEAVAVALGRGIDKEMDNRD